MSPDFQRGKLRLVHEKSLSGPVAEHPHFPEETGLHLVPTFPEKLFIEIISFLPTETLAR